MRRNVLVIDDDKDMCELVTFFLEQKSFIVRSVSDGYAALQELRNNSYDLLILDISLPHLNGFKVLKAIRSTSEFHDLPVIMLSSNSDKDDILRVQKEVSDYVLKPPRKDDFLARVERILGGRPQFQEIRFTEIDDRAKCVLETSLRLVSISARGMVLRGPLPLTKNSSLDSLKISIFKNIPIKLKKFRVLDCTPRQAGGFEYFVSFLGMNALDQKKIRQWIVSESYRRKQKAA